MNKRGNALVIVLVVLLLFIVIFLSVPIGGHVGDIREATISFIFRTPPRFISMEVRVDQKPMVVKAGQAIKIKGNESIVITRINANTFFDSYLTADIEGFGKANDLHEPIDTSAIRKQLLEAGLHSIPIDVYYIDHKIAKIPLEIELTENDFIKSIKQAKDTDEKIALLRNAHTSFPGNKYFLDELDRLLNKKGDYESLVGIYKSIVDSNPNNIQALIKLSRYYIKIGLLEDSLTTCKRIEKLGKAGPGTYRRMAYIEQRLGSIDKSIAYLEKALKLSKNNETVIRDLGRLYLAKKEKQKAISLYKRIAASTRLKEIMIPVIEADIKAKDYKDASRILKHYTKVFPRDKNGFAELAMCMGKLGNTKAQILYSQKAAALAPRDPVILFNLAYAYDMGGNPSRAIDTYLKVLKLKPRDVDALSRAAFLSLKMKHYKDAYRYYSSLTKRSGKLNYIKGLLSSAIGLKDPGKIILASKKYLKKKKDYEVEITLGYAYESRAANESHKERIRDLKSALKAYEDALRLKPDATVPQERIPEVKIQILRAEKGIGN